MEGWGVIMYYKPSTALVSITGLIRRVMKGLS